MERKSRDHLQLPNKALDTWLDNQALLELRLLSPTTPFSFLVSRLLHLTAAVSSEMHEVVYFSIVIGLVCALRRYSSKHRC